MPKIRLLRLASAAFVPVIAGSVAVVMEQAGVSPTAIALTVVLSVIAMKVALAFWNSAGTFVAESGEKASSETSHHSHDREEKENHRDMAAAG